MVAAIGTLEVIAVTAIMVRLRIIDRAITTDVATETIIIRTIVIAIESIMVLTDVSNATHLVIATDHIGTDAMIAGNKKSLL